MKLLLSLFLLSLLSACGSPEIKACEAFVKGGLASPSSYQKVEATTFTDKLPREMFIEASGLAKMGELGKSLTDRAPNPGVRTVLLEYDADNRFGASLRESAVCHFAMTDTETDEFYQGDRLDQLAENAVQQNNFRRLLPSLGEQSADPVGCCLDWNFDPLKLPSGTDLTADEEAILEADAGIEPRGEK